jgi:hypothetical protein
VIYEHLNRNEFILEQTARDFFTIDSISMADISIEALKEPEMSTSFLFANMRNATLEFSLFEMQDIIDTIECFKSNDCEMHTIHLVYNNDLDRKMFADLAGFNIKSLRSDSLCPVVDEQVFHGLDHLESLALTVYDQVPIEDAPFRVLTKLRSLELEIKQTKTIKANLFKNLCKLEELRINARENPATTRVEAKIFQELSNLKRVCIFQTS